MVHLKFSNAEHLKFLINGLKNVTNNINFQFLTEGLLVKGLDNTKSALIDTYLHNSYFESYYHHKDIVFGVCLESFWKILKSIRKKDTAEIFIPESQDFLKITLENESRRGIFKLKQIEMDEETVNIPPILYENKISLASSKFYQMISDLHHFDSSEIKVFTREENILFSIDSNLSQCEIAFKKPTCRIREKNGKKYRVVKNSKGEEKLSLLQNSYQTHSIQKDTSLILNADYLYKFSQLYQLCPEVELEFSNNMPLKIQYDLGTDSYFKYYLAPKCEL